MHIGTNFFERGEEQLRRGFAGRAIPCEAWKLLNAEAFQRGKRV